MLCLRIQCAWEIAQLVLACKCKRRGLRAETPVKTGVWKFVNASSQEVKTGGSLGSLAASLTWR